ncbi:hypothetical protein F5144DRAFT_57965 [Chaetomium tenue]|uniref:Uncharacterized protein n=1 Tax=Chaetomium tenue TaxID=1854479 RepID=A0ACB7PNC2_9PEZI|nr:hypothetical protein F5144DRAFT_57965 [Chaetomium globosum]
MTPMESIPSSPSPPSSRSPPTSNIASALTLTPETPASHPASPPNSPSELDLPQALSLHRILCLHPRERLLLHPVKWTSRHLELLNCSFELPSRAVLNRARFYPPSNERKAAGRARRLATAFGLGFRMHDIVSLLENESGPLISIRDGFNFYYRRLSVGRLPCVGFSLRPESEDSCAPPIAAWAESRLIDDRRAKGFCNAEERDNSPVRHLELLRWKAITPTKPMHDPCILAMLVAVAQGQRLAAAQNKGKTNRPKYRAHVIWTDFKDQEHAHVFTADIPSDFLDGLDDPSFIPPAPVSVSIRHNTVPFKPYKKLYSRLLAVILPDGYPGTRKEPKANASGNDGPLAPPCNYKKA